MRGDLLPVMMLCAAQVAAVAFAPPVAAAPDKPGNPRAATISRVVDGDTMEATSAGGGTIKVRVLGINTPETKDPRKPVECWGPEASRWATNQLQNRRVTLTTDPTQGARDKYGRLLAYIDRAGWDYSTEAARAGMARVAPDYRRRAPQRANLIRAAEREARAARRGLWGQPCEGRVQRTPAGTTPAQPATPPAATREPSRRTTR